jgi:hypothetical protein
MCSNLSRVSVAPAGRRNRSAVERSFIGIATALALEITHVVVRSRAAIPPGPFKEI